MVAGDEVHEAEVQAFDAGQGGNFPGVLEGAVGFDQHVDRNGAADPALGLDAAQGIDLGPRIVDGANLGNGQESEALAGVVDQDFQILAPVGVGDVVDARTDPAEAVVAAADEAGGHFRMFGFGTGVGTVFAVAGDVENGLVVMGQFLLQLQGLLHELFRSGVVVHHRQDGEGLFTGEENVVGMTQGHGQAPKKKAAAFYRGLCSKWLAVAYSMEATAARSSSSSARVAFILPRLYSSISRPWMIL